MNFITLILVLILIAVSFDSKTMLNHIHKENSLGLETLDVEHDTETGTTHLVVRNAFSYQATLDIAELVVRDAAHRLKQKYSDVE